MNFNTAGSIGDSIYQLLFMVELSEALNEKIDEIHIQYGKPCKFGQAHPYKNVQLTEEAANFIKPLFEHTGLANKISISNEMLEGSIDLDLFRKMNLNLFGGDNRLWVYSLIAIPLPMDLQRKIIDVTPNTKFKDKIILSKTNRYCNEFLNMDCLKQWKDQFVFIGLKDEYDDFCKNHFKLDYCPVKDALEFAEIVSGSKGMIGNQSGLFAIAEMCKAPRILCPPEFIKFDGENELKIGPCVVIPQGGKCSLATSTAKLEASMEFFIER